MTQVHINGSDRSTLLLLHVDLPPEAVARFTERAGTGEWPLKYAVGAEKLRDSFVDVVTIKDLAPMSLSQYLKQAYDISSKTLEPDLARIDALAGHVVILPHQAFAAQNQILTIASPLRLIGSYGEARGTAPGAPITTPSAHQQTRDAAPAPRARGNSALLTLIVAAVALILIAVFWIAAG